MTTTPRRRRPRIFSKLLLIVVIAATFSAASWFGLIPQRLSPFPPLSLAEPGQWFIDFRMATLRRDPALCAATLKEPQIAARPIEDNIVNNGCGWENAVRVSSAGGATMPIGALTCEMAAGLALWIEHEIQPLAKRLLGTSVNRIEHMGGYACRNIIGSKVLAGFKSQHARANAIDIASFQFADGRRIRVSKDWNGNGAESQFLKEAHKSACRYFRIALGPDFNAAHHDHFHFDRGPFVRCR